MNDEFSIFRKALENIEENFPVDTYKDKLLVSYGEDNFSTKPTILVIDDDFHVREALKITLEKKYNVFLCANGEDGIEKINSSISAVILDIKMEGKNGFETLKEIKKKNLYIPIIFHSAYHDIKSPMEILNDYRPFGYILKGSDGKELLYTLESAVDYYLQINKNDILYKEMQKKEEQYRLLVNNLNVGVYRNTGGPKGKFLQANPALARIMGYDSVEELMTKSTSDFYENPMERQSFVNKLERKGFCENLEARLRKKDGSIIWVSISATVYKDSSGKLQWIDGILNDITESKKAEKKLHSLMQDINELNLSLEEKVKERTSELNNTLKKIRDDLSVAQQIQANTLHTNFSLIEELNITPVYIPMLEVGGDFYGINKVNDFTYRFFLADATGHGVQAAMITMAVKGIYDNIKNSNLAIHNVMEIFNNEFIDRYISLNSLLTAIIVDIDVKNHKLKYVSAGHPWAVLLRKSKVHHFQKTGRMIGVTKNNIYKSIELDFRSTDRLYIFSDGLFEQFNSRDEEFGEERLYTVLAENWNLKLEQTINNALIALYQFLEGKEHQDDIAILGIEYKAN